MEEEQKKKRRASVVNLSSKGEDTNSTKEILSEVKIKSTHPEKSSFIKAAK